MMVKTQISAVRLACLRSRVMAWRQSSPGLKWASARPWRVAGGFSFGGIADGLEDVLQPVDHGPIVGMLEGGSGRLESPAADRLAVRLRSEAGDELGEGLPLVSRKSQVVKRASEERVDLVLRHAAHR